jgi:hypothetical protein
LSWWGKLFVSVVLLVAVVAVVVVVESGGSHSQPVPPACTGYSRTWGLARVECAAWQDLYDSTNGPKWNYCSDSRSDPCSCSGQVTCMDIELDTPAHITEM